MGSEGPPPDCVLHVTGFKKFHGVDENPTEVVALALEDYIEKRGLPPGLKLGSVTVLETAGHGALAALHGLFDAALASQQRNPADPSVQDRIIWVHMGVNNGSNKFAIERRAVNEATFRCPDEMGWQPQRSPIVSEDGGLSHARETDFPVPNLVDSLVKKGFDVAVSDDAGRFVCNYVYYHSLCHAKAHGTKCLFVHVPPFSKIEGEKQMEFMASLFEILASIW